jgi:hypothetical protein
MSSTHLTPAACRFANISSVARPSYPKVKKSARSIDRASFQSALLSSRRRFDFVGSLSGRWIALAKWKFSRKLPVDCSVTSAATNQPDILLHTMNPLIIGKQLRQGCLCSDFRPCQVTRRLLQGSCYLGLEVIVGHAGLLLWFVPKLTVTRRANPRLFLYAAARYPFVMAPLTTKPHNCDRHSGHVASIAGGYSNSRRMILKY